MKLLVNNKTNVGKRKGNGIISMHPTKPPQQKTKQRRAHTSSRANSSISPVAGSLYQRLVVASKLWECNCVDATHARDVQGQNMKQTKHKVGGVCTGGGGGNTKYLAHASVLPSLDHSTFLTVRLCASNVCVHVHAPSARRHILTVVSPEHDASRSSPFQATPHTRSVWPHSVATSSIAAPTPPFASLYVTGTSRPLQQSLRVRGEPYTTLQVRHSKKNKGRGGDRVTETGARHGLLCCVPGGGGGCVFVFVVEAGEDTGVCLASLGQPFSFFVPPCFFSPGVSRGFEKAGRRMVDKR